MDNLKNRIQEIRKQIEEKDRELDEQFEVLGSQLNNNPELRKRDNLSSFITRLDLVQEENKNFREVSRKISHLEDKIERLNNSVNDLEKILKEDKKKQELLEFELGKEAWQQYQKNPDDFIGETELFTELRLSLSRRDELEKEMETAVLVEKKFWKKLISGGRRTVISGRLKNLDNKRDEQLLLLGKTLGENQDVMKKGSALLGSGASEYIEFTDNLLEKKNEISRMNEEKADFQSTLDSLCETHKPAKKKALIDDELGAIMLTEKGVCREMGELYFLDTLETKEEIPDSVKIEWEKLDSVYQKREQLRDELDQLILIKEIDEIKKENSQIEARIDRKKETVQELQKEIRSSRKTIQNNKKIIEEKESRINNIEPASD